MHLIAKLTAALAIAGLLCVAGCGPQDGANDAPDGNGTAISTDGAEPSAEKLLDEARQSFDDEEVDTGLALLDRAVEARPQDRETLHEALELATTRAVKFAREEQKDDAAPLMLKAAGFARRMLQEHAPLKDREQQFATAALYNEATVLAAEGKPQQALASLKEAYAAGFDRVMLLSVDDSLDPLRDISEFQEFVAEQQRLEVERLLERNRPFPFSFSLPSVRDEDVTVSLADFRGQVVVVDFWGTWCPPCKAEIPHFIDLQERLGGEGLTVVGLSYEQVSSDEIARIRVQRFIEENGINYPCALGNEQTRAAVPNFEGFPTTLFVDRTGQVRLKLMGYQPLEKLEAIVKVLLSEMPQ
ncbi:MAG: TlpA family protein disulfide reductase [Planctomycetes bacterium]|nr:TlpA family protein disulfide reductase [Planctomycetota bacterium]